MIDKIKYKKILSYIMCLAIIFTGYILLIEITGGLEKEYNISIGDYYILNQKFPLHLSKSDSSLDSIIKIENINQKRINLNKSFELKTINKGTTNFQLKVFGIVPYRNITVNVVPRVDVIPGGQSIGVRLNTEGVLVVGTAQITDINGRTINLAETAGIRIGDSLIAINDTKVNNAEHVGNLIQDSEGLALKLTLKRDSKKFNTSVKPIQSLEDQQYRLGLWVRDKTAGVGTMTFNHPETQKFGALGHAITDIDTGNILSIKDGEIIRSRVVSIQQGKRGKPGEIRGVFYDTNEPLGSLERNTDYGVYGQLINNLENELFKNAIPIAYQHEINEGPAHILTTIDTNRVDKYAIEITRINPQTKVDSKSMIIRVTDEKLLEKTGGIIQGMSGSPILQNGKLVGAVTHVLINDPTKGYAIFIEWMIEESGIFDNDYENAVEN